MQSKITNRHIAVKNGKEIIEPGGKEEAGSNLRFAEYLPGKRGDALESRYRLYDDMPQKEVVAKVSEATGEVTFKNPYADNANKFSNFTKPQLRQLDGSERFFASLYQAMRNGREQGGDTLLFVHGFNNDLEKALDTLEELVETYVKDPNCTIDNVVLFTWPSCGNLLRYRNDQQDARNSGIAMLRAYCMLQEFFNTAFAPKRVGTGATANIALRNPLCDKHIHLMCHSMGNQVLVALMEAMIKDGVAVKNLFTELVMVGSDVDWDSFNPQKPLFHINNICERVSVYYNDKDFALFISDTTKGHPKRLGKDGPQNLTDIPSHIYFMDVSKAPDINPLGRDAIIHHWYYKDSAVVRADILQVFAGTTTEEISTRQVVPGSTIKFRVK